MAVLAFDENNGFETDLENFLVHMESADAELGKILRTHIDELKNATYEKARKDARTAFNAKVLTSLDALIKVEEK